MIPGYYGTNAVKWVWRVELSAERAGGPFTTEFYNDPDASTGAASPVWEAPPEALIVSPAPGPVAAAPVEIAGWAWGAAWIARVEISADDGATSSSAQLEARRKWSWQRSRLTWQPAGGGKFTLAARATDRRGSVQPMRGARNAVHRATVAIA